MASVDDLTFTLSSDGTYYSVKATATTIAGDLEIPSEYSGLPVKKIDASGFKSCAKLTSVVVPESITALPDSAFQDCTGITALTLPSGLTTLGANSVRNCKKLTSIDLPAGLTSIGGAAFYGCSSLTSIDLPAGLTSIWSYAFYYCSSLTSIDLPAGLTSIGTNSFSYCQLVSITVDSANTVFHSEGNCCIRTATNQLAIGCKTSVIPDYITSIGNCAFEGRYNLTSIDLPAGLTSIGTWAFASCTSLTSIDLPAGLTSIGDDAFYYCSSLTSIDLPAGLTSIGGSAFRSMTKLTSFKFEGDKVAEPTDVFLNTTNLKEVHVNAFATGYGETWGGKAVVVDNPVYLGGTRISKAYFGENRVRKWIGDNG